MRILVTGAAGFIGSSLALEILRRWKDAEVLGLDNMNDTSDPVLRRERLSGLEGSDAFRFVCADIADKAAVMRVFGQFRPEVVVNMAAQAGVRYSIDHPDPFMESNIIGFYNILEACRESYSLYDGGVRHLVFASSSSIYGMNDSVPYSTDARTDCPVSLYAATKKSNELMAYAYCRLYDIPATALRFFTVYGPQGRPDMAYFSFARKMAAGERISLFNYGNCRRDFTYVDDVVEVMMRVLQKATERSKGGDGLPVPPYRVYNVGNSSPVALLDFVTVLHEELVAAGAVSPEYKLQDMIDLLPMQPGDVVETYADTSALEADFGFRPSTSLREGLRAFALWFSRYMAQNL